MSSWTLCRLQVQGMRILGSFRGCKVGKAQPGGVGSTVGLSQGSPCPLGPATGDTWSWSIQGLGWELCWSLIKHPPLLLIFSK